MKKAHSQEPYVENAENLNLPRVEPFFFEIGTITPGAQIKLLQVLQDGTYQWLGGNETLKTDVRVIAASNAVLISLKELWNIHPLVIEAFEKDAWPGNIRELKNLVERAYTLARNGGKINDSARVAGISCRQLNNLMNKYGIRKEEFKVS